MSNLRIFWVAWCCGWALLWMLLGFFTLVTWPLPCRCQRCEAVIFMTRSVTVIHQLPAVDRAEQPRRVAAPCPYCGTGMLRAFPRARRVTCLLAGAPCLDADGNPPAGVMGRSGLDGSPVITWADGLVT